MRPFAASTSRRGATARPHAAAARPRNGSSESSSTTTPRRPPPPRKNPMASKLASIHIDMDSPNTLLRFWGFDGNCHDLDSFYEVAMTRALGLLRESGVHATFFCIGEELEKSPVAAAMVRQTHLEGHEIPNHTEWHPLRLTSLSATAIRRGIPECSRGIRPATGTPPPGFRPPGYRAKAA